MPASFSKFNLKLGVILGMGNIFFFFFVRMVGK